MNAPAHVRRLAEMLAPPRDGKRGMLAVPGCWDGLTALLIEQAGFPVAFLTGGGFSMTRLGLPDMGLVDAGEVENAIAAIRDRVSLPLIVDGDTGFGNALNMTRTVRRFERAGASAIQIEDQRFPKRCGHMAGKQIIPLSEAIGKLNAALDARTHCLISARTDAVAIEGFEAALDRAEAFLEAGADMIMIEGPRTLAETKEVGRRFGARVPLVHNLVEGGVSATKSAVDLEAMGFAVALHPLFLLHGFAKAAPRWLKTLHAERSSERLETELLSLTEMNAITGAPALITAGEKYGADG